jgi:hypothetical protein
MMRWTKTKIAIFRARVLLLWRAFVKGVTSPLSLLLLGLLGSLFLMRRGIQSGFFAHFAPEFIDKADPFGMSGGFVLNMGSEFVGITFGALATSVFVEAYRTYRSDKKWDFARDQVAEETLATVVRMTENLIDLMQLRSNAKEPHYFDIVRRLDSNLNDIRGVLRDYAILLPDGAVKAFPRLRNGMESIEGAKEILTKRFYTENTSTLDFKHQARDKAVPNFHFKLIEIEASLKLFCMSLNADPDYSVLMQVNSRFEAAMRKFRTWLSDYSSKFKEEEQDEETMLDQQFRRVGYLQGFVSR